MKANMCVCVPEQHRRVLRSFTKRDRHIMKTKKSPIVVLSKCKCVSLRFYSYIVQTEHTQAVCLAAMSLQNRINLCECIVGTYTHCNLSFVGLIPCRFGIASTRAFFVSKGIFQFHHLATSSTPRALMLCFVNIPFCLYKLLSFFLSLFCHMCLIFFRGFIFSLD